MKNVAHLKDSQLLSQIQFLASQERRLSTDILVHLREVEKRKLHLQRGFSSIFEYTVKELKYSDAAAARRVNAMRLLKEFSDVSSSIETGALNLSSISAVQSFIKREEKERGKVFSVGEKRELLQAVENKSKRECEKVLADRSPLPPISRPKAKTSKETQTAITIVLSVQQKEKLEKVRDLLTEKKVGGSYAELLELMADMVLDGMNSKNTQEVSIVEKTNKDKPNQEKAKTKRPVNPQRKLRWKKKAARAKPQLRLLA